MYVLVDKQKTHAFALINQIHEILMRVHDPCTLERAMLTHAFALINQLHEILMRVHDPSSLGRALLTYADTNTRPHTPQNVRCT